MSLSKKCPKCKSSNLYFKEIWSGFSFGVLQDDLFAEDIVSDSKFNKEPGYPVKVNAECNNCNHYWTIRGVKSLEDITKF